MELHSLNQILKWGIFSDYALYAWGGAYMLSLWWCHQDDSNSAVTARLYHELESHTLNSTQHLSSRCGSDVESRKET